MKIEQNCPFDKFRPCRQTKCALFTQIRGTNPQTGSDVDDWGCALAFMPMLQIEGAQMSRQAGAAVESLRNELVTQTEQLVDVAKRRVELLS